MANNVDGEIKLGVKLTIADIQKTARDLQKQVSGIFDSVDTSKLTPKMQRVLATMGKLAAQSQKLTNEMGRFANEQIPTEEYSRLSKQLEKENAQFDRLTIKAEELRDIGKDSGPAWEKLDAQLERLGQNIRDDEADLKELVDTGKAFTLGSETERYADMGNKLNDLNNQMVIYNSTWKQADGKAERNLRNVSTAAKKASFNVGKFVSHLLKMAGHTIREGFSRVISGMRNIFKQSRNIQRTSRISLKNILAYAIGIRSLFALITKLKAALHEGMNNLVRWNDGANEANKVISELTSSLLYLKNSLAAAFTPIMTVVAPILSKFTDMLAEAINKLGMFFAYMTGKTKYIQAKKVMQDYAKSLGEVNDKLAEYDKLSVISEDDPSKDPNNMFEEVSVPISGGIADWVDKFRQAWKDADFSEIGRTIGQKLKEALDSIPWEQIKEAARKVGKSLATFINGFVEVEGLGESIGKTIAEAFNTALEFAYQFVTNLDWEAVGRFISDAIMGFFTTFDWDLFTGTVAGFINGMVDLLTTVLTETDWDEIGNKIGQCFTDLIEKIDWKDIGKLAAEAVNAFFELIQGISDTFDADKLGTAIADTINEAIKNIKWKENSQSLSDLVINLIDTLASTVEKIDWKDFGNAILEAVEGIKWKDIFESSTTLAIDLFQALIDLLIGFLDNDPDEFFNVGQNIVDGIAGGVENANLEKLGESLQHLMYRAIYWAMPRSVRDFMDALKEWGDKIKAAKEGKATMEDVGEAQSDALREGFEAAALLGVPKSVQLLYRLLIHQIKEKFDIHSPSGVLEEMGGYLIAGFKNGIENGTGAVVRVVEDLKNALLSPFNAILAGVEFVVNGIIDGLNWVIDKLNGFRIDVPSAVQSAIEYMGGPSIDGFSFNLGRLDHVQIPRLAEGAVIPPNKQFLAMLGDQTSGTNIEAPLETMVAAFKQALSEEGSNHSPIVLQLDGRTVAQVVWDETDKKYKQTGQYIPRYA